MPEVSEPFPFRALPKDIAKWILSFVTAPRDFVRLRTVCREWNKILGELFFSMTVVETQSLIALVDTHRVFFTEYQEVPLALGTDELEVSDRWNGRGVVAQCEAKNAGTRREPLYAFAWSSILLKVLEESSAVRTTFVSCDLLRRAACKTVNLKVGGGPRNKCLPACDFEISTTVGMLLGACGRSARDPALRLSAHLIEGAIPGRRVLLFSSASWTRREYLSRLDTFFVEKEGAPTQWEPLGARDLGAIEAAAGRRLLAREEDLVFDGRYNVTP